MQEIDDTTKGELRSTLSVNKQSHAKRRAAKRQDAKIRLSLLLANHLSLGQDEKDLLNRRKQERASSRILPTSYLMKCRAEKKAIRQAKKAAHQQMFEQLMILKGSTKKYREGKSLTPSEILLAFSKHCQGK